MQKLILAITDGIGINEDNFANAFAAAKKPNYSILERDALKCRLKTSGEAVGLPKGQIGNSEVGHMCLGSGQVIFQSLVKIDRAIADGSLAAQSAMAQLLERVKNGARVHVFGLYSDGGVHSHFSHFNACCKLLALAAKSAKSAAAAGQNTAATAQNAASEPKVFAHAIGDGRDVLPKSMGDFLQNNPPFIPLASLAGRFFAMDRDNNHDRTAAYMNMLQSPQATGDLALALESAKSDEFVEPTMLKDGSEIRPGDEALIINFRADRARQLAAALKDFGAQVTCMCEYDAALGLPVIFPPERVQNCLAQVLSERNLRQLHTSETEKYAHVSFFFNGGREQPYPGESRVLVPSTGAKSYAQTPKMSAAAIADAAIEGIKSGTDFIVLNFANGDMVGHTGDFDAAVIAVEEVDAQLGRLMAAAREAGSALLVCSDHGNCEQMRDPQSGEMLTNHTLFDVACWLYNFHGAAGKGLADGSLANVAATVLEVMGIPKPEQMQESLLKNL